MAQLLEHPLPLFPDLPSQEPPAVIWTDEHSLERCVQCNGTGRQKCWYPPWYDVAQTWDETCRHCRGAGRVLRHWGKIVEPPARWPA